MSHYAQIDENNIVVQVIVAEQYFIDSGAVGDPTRWIQTSYNTYGGTHYGLDGQPDNGIALRKNYAGIGYTYDSTRDAFIPPKPYPSWVLNEDTCLWEAPVAIVDFDPTFMYNWNEDTKSWETTIPVLPVLTVPSLPE